MAAALSGDAGHHRLSGLCHQHGGDLHRGFMDGHIPTSNNGSDIDSWSHIIAEGTHRAIVLSYPRSGLIQGAGAYLRDVATGSRISPRLAANLRAALHDEDTQRHGARRFRPGQA